MIVRVYHNPDREGIRALTSNRDAHVQQAREGSLPAAALDATSRPGSFAYFEATEAEDGMWLLGAASTGAAFASGR